MKKTQIPNTDLIPSSLCMGTGDFGGSIERNLSFDLLDTFIDHGGSFIDTAKIYNDWIPGETSRSEKIIGEWMRLRKKRQLLILATKGAHYSLSTPHIPRVSSEDIICDLNASLKHLQTDVIDLYWLHRDDPNRPVEEIITTLYSQVETGKIRYYGCSNWSLERIRAAQKFATENHLPGFSAVQNMWNLAKINPVGISDPTIIVMDDALEEYHSTYQLTAIPFSSQANGLFQKMAASNQDSLSEMHKRMYLNPETQQRFSRLQALRESTGLSITQVVIGYLLGQPFPTIPVFSSRSQFQLLDTLSAADTRLSREQIYYLKG